MIYLTAIIHKDKGSAYGLTFPDLPGCYAAADSWRVIEKAAVRAVSLWFEDQPPVVPAPVEEVLQRPEVEEALRGGAILAVLTFPNHNLL